MIELPVIGAFFDALGTIFEKKVLRGRKIDFKDYTTYEFLSIIIVALPIIIFTWRVGAGALSAQNILIFALVILVATIANLLVFYSLKRKDVTEFEPIWLMQPLFVIVLAFILFKNERNLVPVGLALIASITLVLAHVKKSHLNFDKYIIAAVIGSFLFAVELVASKPLLQYYDPFTFYYIRCFFIFLICFSIFRSKGSGLSKGTKIIIILTGISWVLNRAITYWGYENLGIVFTTTLLILSPVFLYTMAALFLKEKPTWRQIISAVVIVACVLLSVYLQH